MTDPRFQRLIDIVGEAMLRPASERESYLASACEGDEMLLREARELVAREAIPSPEQITARVEALLGEAAGEVEEIEGQPSEIGPYRVLGTLGRGGMGSVYLARQEKPLERDVAIKVVRGGVVDRQMLARFASETQALARMQHPNIARVFDAGRTDDGLPYLVMEYVDGIPVTDFCAEHGLALPERITLFQDVCRAVHHAHQRGVIHRDLKPSNILVMERDGRPFPKVIDFGIAKAAEGLLGEESVHTRAGSLVGTVDYMSPEQLRGDATAVDVRTDVYSLGIVLYQLVSGRHPFADTTLRRAGLLEARRIALESDPPRPSRNSVAAGAEGQGEDHRPGGRARPYLRPGSDLDWVVMKAIEKDRERRYASALDLLRDLERYERDEPVSAGPPSLAYRGRKFVRRHRMGVTAAATVFLALFFGAVAAGVGFVRASDEAERAQTISTFLTDMLASVRPDEEGRSVTVQEVLDEARARLEAGEFSDRPETEASLALVIGHSYEGLGRYDEAVEMIRHSAELRRRLHGAEDERLHASLYRLGTVLWKRGDLDEALALREELETMTATLFGPRSPQHAESLSNLGNTHADRGELSDARGYLEEAVAVGRTLPGEPGRLDLARFLNNLGTVFVDLEEYEPARAAFQETLDIRRPILGEHNDVYAITLGNLGSAQMGLGDLEAAEATFRRAVELDEDIYGPDHPRTASAYSGLASVLSRQGRLDEAELLVRDALRIRSAASGPNGWRAAGERRKLGELLMAMGRMQEAQSELQRAWDGLVAVGEETTGTGREVEELLRDLDTRADPAGR